MLRLPGTAAQFLDRHWQKAPLFIPRATKRLRPAVTRNELGWLATLDDVESRLVFTNREDNRIRYHAESGPFSPEYLAELPKRDWTLLVHDVEKHLPNMRSLFSLVPFIPDWRIDDLMVSFAAPGGGVGPHRDNYDVFLCQGIGVREWRVTTEDVDDDPRASSQLALTREFASGELHEAREGDVLYLPPGVAHWGTAQRACITYSIGMRAPQLSDLGAELPDDECTNPFYADPDLDVAEARPGYIADASLARARRLVGGGDDEDIAQALGRFASATKDWISPDKPSTEETEAILDRLHGGSGVRVHGMARITWDEHHVCVNGRCRALPRNAAALVADICATRRVRGVHKDDPDVRDVLRWMTVAGAFEIPGNY